MFLIPEKGDFVPNRNFDQKLIDSPTYNNIYLEKSDNSELLLAKNVPADSRVMSP